MNQFKHMPGISSESEKEKVWPEKPDFLLRYEAGLDSLQDDIEKTRMSIPDLDQRKWMPVFRNKINISSAVIFRLQQKGLLNEAEGLELNQKALILKQNTAPVFGQDKKAEGETDPEDPEDDKKKSLISELRNFGEEIVSKVEAHIEEKRKSDPNGS